MGKINKLISVLFLLFFLIMAGAACSQQGKENNKIRLTLLHFNDIYEITPVGGGKDGGLARLAAYRKSLLKKNPNTITLLAGDLFSPSAMGTIKVNGERLAGKQMVDVLNHLGVDYVTFGNHEFDIKKEAFYARLAQSRFSWISSNVYDEKGESYPGVLKNKVFKIDDKKSGKSLKVGLFGVTLTKNQTDYVSFTDPFKAAAEQVKLLRDKVDILVALTHLSVEDDITLAETLPGIDLILGGHEHENFQRMRGSDFTPIFKADANVRSVYVINLEYDSNSGRLIIDPSFKPINDKMPEDAAVAKVVKGWVDKAFAAIRETGLNPDEVVAITDIPLDGREASVRNQPTKLTDLITVAMMKAFPRAELALLNGGSIRIDDVIPPGKITTYDIIRVLPFGGYVKLVSIKGSLLSKVLSQGEANKGSGGYLQIAGISQNGEGGWLINGNPLEKQLTYKLAINDFLLSGKEQGLSFLSLDNPAITLIEEGEQYELRKVVINYMKKW